MNENLIREMRSFIKGNGFIVVVEDDKTRKEEFVNELQNSFPQIEVLSEYSLDKYKSINEIKSALQNSPILLANLDDELENVWQKEKIYNKKLSKKESVYYKLVEFREHTRKYPLIVLCNSENKRLIMTSKADLHSHIRDIIFLERFREEMLP